MAAARARKPPARTRFVIPEKIPDSLPAIKAASLAIAILKGARYESWAWLTDRLLADPPVQEAVDYVAKIELSVEQRELLAEHEAWISVMRVGETKAESSFLVGCPACGVLSYAMAKPTRCLLTKGCKGIPIQAGPAPKAKTPAEMEAAARKADAAAANAAADPEDASAQAGAPVAEEAPDGAVDPTAPAAQPPPEPGESTPEPDQPPSAHADALLEAPADGVEPGPEPDDAYPTSDAFDPDSVIEPQPGEWDQGEPAEDQPAPPAQLETARTAAAGDGPPADGADLIPFDFADPPAAGAASAPPGSRPDLVPFQF